MILSCPDCGSRFAVDPAKLEPDGRRVKCGKCAHVWFESPPESPDEDEAPEPLRLTPLDPEEQAIVPAGNLPAVRRGRAGFSARTAWIVVGVLLAAVVAVLWFARGPIAIAWPPAEKVYASAGISVFPPPGEGLEIEFNARAEAGALSLNGEVINISDDVRDVPTLHVLITDEAGGTLKTWAFNPETRRLGPGERVAFSTETREIPERAANVSISFPTPDENP
jgi:predicted Zn finger-like uncharacterized protein